VRAVYDERACHVCRFVNDIGPPSASASASASA
jgi:hypothetical protein